MNLALASRVAGVLSLLFFVAMTSAAEPTAFSVENFKLEAFVAAAGDRDFRLELAESFRMNAPKSGQFIIQLVASRDGKHLFVVRNSRITILDLASKEERELPIELETKIVRVALSPDAKYLLIVPEKREPYLVETTAGKRVTDYSGIPTAPTAAIITDDQKHAMFCDLQGSVHRFPLTGGERVQFTSKSLEERAAGDQLELAAIAGNGRAAIASKKPMGNTTHMYYLFLPEDDNDKVSMNIFTSSRGISNVLWFGNWFVFLDEIDSGRLNFQETEGDRYYRQWSPVSSRVNQIEITPDGKTLLLSATKGHPDFAEIRSMQVPGVRRAFQLADFVTAVTLLPDGRRIAVGEGGKLVIYELRGEYEPREAQISRCLEALLHGRKYAELESVFRHYEKDRTPFAWAPNKTPHAYLSELLRSPSGARLRALKNQAAIETWADSDAKSVTAQLLLAQIYRERAWMARGGGLANAVTEEGWRGFADNMKKMAEIVTPLCEQDEPPAPAFELLFSLFMAAGADQDVCEPYVEKLLKQAPDALEAHFVMAQKMQRRWGGEAEDMHKYATRVADAIGEANGDAIYARIALSQKPFFGRHELLEQSGLDYARTMRGIEHLGKTASDADYLVCHGIALATDARDADQAQAFGPFLKGKNVALIWPLDARHENVGIAVTTGRKPF